MSLNISGGNKNRNDEYENNNNKNNQNNSADKVKSSSGPLGRVNKTVAGFVDNRSEEELTVNKRIQKIGSKEGLIGTHPNFNDLDSRKRSGGSNDSIDPARVKKVKISSDEDDDDDVDDEVQKSGNDANLKKLREGFKTKLESLLNVPGKDGFVSNEKIDSDTKTRIKSFISTVEKVKSYTISSDLTSDALNIQLSGMINSWGFMNKSLSAFVEKNKDDQDFTDLNSNMQAFSKATGMILAGMKRELDNKGVK